MLKKPDMLTIEDELDSRADELKRDKEAIAAFPDLRERLSQYRKNKGPKRKWCPDCYITKKTETLGPPMPSGEQRASYTCGKCKRTYEVDRYERDYNLFPIGESGFKSRRGGQLNQWLSRGSAAHWGVPA